MTVMRSLHTMVGAVALVSAVSCADLDVANPNNPDIERVLATPEDVRNLAISTMRSWYLASTYIEPYLMFEVTADALTANYGNFGMRFNNLEPRIAYENNSAGGDRLVAEEPWNQNYAVLGAANDVLRAFDSGMELASGDTDKYRHLAMFTQAAALTNLALIFDKAFIVDENTDVVNAPPDLVPYTEVSAAALAKWQTLIAETDGAGYSYDPTVIPMDPGPLNSSRLNRIANTMAALLVAYTARTEAEADDVDWAQVAQFADDGIGTGSAGAPFDFQVVGNGNTWWSYINYYGNEQSWTRVDMRLINMMDPSQPSKFTGTIPPAATSADARLASDFQYHGAVIGDAGRGIYMQSPYSHKRYAYHAALSPTDAEGEVPYLLAAESDLIRAQALIETGGDLSVVAQLINNSRVGRGELAPATAADGAAALMTMIEYERDIELLNTSGFTLFQRRIVDGVQPGTVRQLPIPAAELETLGLPIYTFGGGGT